MMRRGPGPDRPHRGPQARDFLRFGRREGRSPRPEARIPGKHALNPPIVTIFGAGVSGLTAAHELVERGFVVQVVEEREDPYCPGRPLVGGMAANQPVRVRPNVEDIHRDLMEIARSEPQEPRGRVAGWLLRVFAFNRSRWLQTEERQRVHDCIYAKQGDDDKERFQAGLLETLKAARAAYKRRWIWDLILRGALLDAITYKDERKKDRPALLREARSEFERLEKLEAADLAVEILKAGIGPQDLRPDIERPARADVRSLSSELVVPAFEREFLCFRLVPYARQGFEKAAHDARSLYQDWSGVFAQALPHSCLSRADERDRIPVGVAEGPPEFPGRYQAWLQIDIMEQRLPGEHGYRFFPSFYRHLDDTMRRTPLFSGRHATGRSVLDNLRPTVFQGIGLKAGENENDEDVAWNDDDPDACGEAAKDPRKAVVVELHRNRARSVEGFRDRTDRFVKRLGGTQRDALLLMARLVRFMTSSPERRREEYEGQSWAHFLGIKKDPTAAAVPEDRGGGPRKGPPKFIPANFSRAMAKQIESAAQALVAFSAASADARTYGNIAVQMLLDQLDDGTRVDRTLNGPTSDAWLEPWRDYLERQGVRFFCRRLDQLKLIDGELVPVMLRATPSSAGAATGREGEEVVSQDGYRLLTHEEPDPSLRPDFYVLALNLERVRELVLPLPRHEEEARDFDAIHAFSAAVDKRDAMKDMTGLQFFFDARTSIGRGHMYFPHANWGLSSISQTEFWSARGGFADGYFGVLSVDVCDTGKRTQPPPKGSFWEALMKGASPEVEGLDEDSRRFALADKVWKEISTRISERDRLAEPRCFNLDQNVSAQNGNTSKFLASVTGLDESRPGRSRDGACVGRHEIEYAVNRNRWVMCGTFMATHTRMTTMEAANESARHAVIAILKQLARSDADEALTARGGEVLIENLCNKTYNGASDKRAYDEPDTWNPEEQELEDLDIFRRVDRRLWRLKLGHFMDIINFDRKLEHTLDAVDIFGEEKSLADVLATLASALDAGITKERGSGWFGRIKAPLAELDSDAGADPLFADLKELVGRVKKLFGAG